MEQPVALKPENLSLAELLSAFAFAADLAFGLELEDGLRSTYIADRIAERMGLTEDERLTVYYASLLKDAGCTCWTTSLADFWQTNEIEARRDLLIFGGEATMGSYVQWLRRYVGAGMQFVPRLSRALTVLMQSGPFMTEGYATSVEVCSRITKRLGLPASVQEATLDVFERWDGKGEPRHLRGDEIPVASQVILPTFVLSPIHRVAGREAVCEIARGARGGPFSPRVVDAFLEVAEDYGFWDDIERGDLYQLVLDREPASSLAAPGADFLDDVAYAFADFVDLKSPFTAAHSRRVARIAEQIGVLMGCSVAQCALLRQGALMHDLGLVAVPSQILNKPERSLSRADVEVLRLHPYQGERVLDRVSAMKPLMSIIGHHHERMDGNGYYRGIRARDLPLETRIIAVANRLDELTHAAPGEGARELPSALEVLQAEARDGLDEDVVAAVIACLGASNERPPARQWPAGLTEREVEVLRLAARGYKRREIGEVLSITENTVRHHLEHIYAKTETTTRVGATLFAMENDLID